MPLIPHSVSCNSLIVLAILQPEIPDETKFRETKLAKINDRRVVASKCCVKSWKSSDEITIVKPNSNTFESFDSDLGDLNSSVSFSYLFKKSSYDCKMNSCTR